VLPLLDQAKHARSRRGADVSVVGGHQRTPDCTELHRVVETGIAPSLQRMQGWSIHLRATNGRTNEGVSDGHDRDTLPALFV
jgi:hypothetical protein